MLRLAEWRTGTLQAAIQDAAAVTVDRKRAQLLGGLTAADISRADIRLAERTHDHAAGALPVAVDDTAAVRIRGVTYLFGGGANAGAQSDAIVRVTRHGGGRRTAARAELGPGGCRDRRHGIP